MALSVLATLFGILMIAFPADNDVSGQREAGAFIAIFFLAISIFLGIALMGKARSQPWGLGVATLAALLIALTGVGVLIAGPILWGLWHPRHGKPAARPADRAVDSFDPVEIRHALDHALKISRRRLPHDLYHEVAKIRTEILALLPHAANFPTGSRDLFVIQRTATDYLPASLKAYLSLPRNYKVEGSKTAVQVLEDQLDLLDGKMSEIADAVRQQDAERLLIHGRFLQDQFEIGRKTYDFRL